MNTIDLDAIISGIVGDNSFEHPQDVYRQEVRRAMKEAVHQALVLASEKGYDAAMYNNIEEDHAAYIKQSILDVDKLIN